MFWLQSFCLFYKVLAELAALRTPDYRSSAAKSLIRESIDHLEDHIFDPKLRVEDPVARADVSGAFVLMAAECAEFEA